MGGRGAWARSGTCTEEICLHSRIPELLGQLASLRSSLGPISLTSPSIPSAFYASWAPYTSSLRNNLCIPPAFLLLS